LFNYGHTSVLVLQGRHSAVRDRFGELLARDQIAVCQMTALEFLNNAPDPKGYEVLWAALRRMSWFDVTTGPLTVPLTSTARWPHRASIGTSGYPI